MKFETLTSGVGSTTNLFIVTDAVLFVVSDGIVYKCGYMYAESNGSTLSIIGVDSFGYIECTAVVAFADFGVANNIT
jgi:hypothetical protein